MLLSVLICTLNEGIKDVAQILLPKRDDVNYIISFQYTEEYYLSLIPDLLSLRDDVAVHTLRGKGLSINRNNALMYATGDIALIADDDVRYKDEYFDTILKTFQEHTDVDIALFRAKSYDGEWLKKYPEYSYDYMNILNEVYPSSFEIVMRTYLYEKGIRFDERFGLGTDFLACGEESVFLEDSLKNNFKIVYFPKTIVETDYNTTGLKILIDKKVQRSKGAVFFYCYGFRKAFYLCLKESLYHFIHSGVNPFTLLRNMYDGIEYCKKTNRRN